MRVGLTMRVVHPQGYQEPRDAISHDWIRVLEDMGWPEEVIMAEMGHSVLSVSRTYREASIRRQALKRHQEHGPMDLL